MKAPRMTSGFGILLAVSLLWFNPAQAGGPTKVTVTAANPNNAQQGEALDVVISGSGFGQGATVRYLVTNTSDDSQISVMSVTYDEANDTLITLIQVSGEAIINDYDIEVRSAGGRRGKGTTLFKVNSSDANNETGAALCSDGIDNDGDGKIDGEDEGCAGSAKPTRDNTKRGTAIPLVVTLDDNLGDSLWSDGRGSYRDGEEKVVAEAGGSLPSRLYVHPQNTGKNFRTVTVEVECAPIPDTGAGDAIDNCDLLTDNFGDPFTFTGGYIFQAIPYSINCPEAPAPCDDVFSMGESTRLFSFKLLSGVAPIIEAASDIGGATAVEAGRCLSFLPSSQRDYFINTVCADKADCNVSVTASDMNADGENDDWMVDGVAITALICSSNNDGIVFGQTVLNIGYHARVK